MATPQNRKRRRADEPSRNQPPKKIRQDDRDPDDYLITWRYPPAFWDRLSTIPLEQAALEELDRRNSTRPSFPPRPTHPAEVFLLKSARDIASKITGFAQHGGPDLTDLRGYPDPNNKAMSSSSRSRAAGSTNPTTVTTTTKSRKSRTPYDRGCEQHFIDYDIHPSWGSQAPDLEDLNSALAVPRPSLSPSQFSNSAFSNFKRTNAQANDEEDVKTRVLPTIAGPTDQLSSMNTIFGNLAPLTDGSLAPAKPDVYYGAYPKELDRTIRDELGHHIIPSTMKNKPLVPNFFTEIKGPDGSPAVMQKQARYDGAIGARGIHSLQNYGNNEPVYDGKPYMFSSTYHGGTGTLQLYTHHMTEPATPGGRPEYHMAELKGFLITDSREAFVQGATAFRNARDVAKRYRDSFIQAANERARQSGEGDSSSRHNGGTAG